MQKYSEFESIFEDSISLKISDSSTRFQIPIGILNDLCWIPVGVGPLDLVTSPTCVIYYVGQ